MFCSAVRKKQNFVSKKSGYFYRQSCVGTLMYVSSQASICFITKFDTLFFMCRFDITKLYFFIFIFLLECVLYRKYFYTPVTPHLFDHYLYVRYQVCRLLGESVGGFGQTTAQRHSSAVVIQFKMIKITNCWPLNLCKCLQKLFIASTCCPCHDLSSAIGALQYMLLL